MSDDNDTRYESQFGGLRLTPAQWLAERMVDRQAQRKGITLPQQFWRDPRWKADFVRQNVLANQLLRIYEIEAILRALKTADGKRVFSLAAKFLDPIVQNEQRKLIQERQEAAERPKPPERPPYTPEPPRPAFVGSKKSILGKLRELDGRSKTG